MNRKTLTLTTLAVFVLAGAPAKARSVDPESWVKSDLIQISADTYSYDHHHFCSLKGEAADASHRVLVRVTASAPTSAISRDQFVALIQRMEAVYLMGIGEGWRPGMSAMETAGVLDCRPRLDPGEVATQTMEITVTKDGFSAAFTDRASGVTSHHIETWPEAFRR